MLRDKYKIILIKLDSVDESKEYQVSLFKIFSIISLFTLFFGINLYFFSGDILHYFESREFKKMIENNIGLSDLVKEQNNQLQHIDGLVDSLRVQEEKFRKLVRLPSIHSDTKRLGTSKNKRSNEQSFNNYQNLLPNNMVELKEVVYNVDHINRLLNLELLSYDQILSKTEENINRIQRYPGVHPVDFETCKKTKWVKGKKVMGDCYHSSGFGIRFHPVHLKWKKHHGLDYAADKGTAVYATADGKVVKSQYSENTGQFIKIKHGFGYETLYGHLSVRNVKKGDIVQRGDKIGEVGKTGKYQDGEHLHYEVHVNDIREDPEKFTNFDLSNVWKN